MEVQCPMQTSAESPAADGHTPCGHFSPLRAPPFRTLLIDSKLLIEKRVLAGAENVLNALSGKKRKSKRQKQQVSAAEAM